MQKLMTEALRFSKTVQEGVVAWSEGRERGKQKRGMSVVRMVPNKPIQTSRSMQE